jgi:hypothetical protein
LRSVFDCLEVLMSLYLKIPGEITAYPATMSRRVLQRACACGQHTVGSGGECEECKRKRQDLLQRTTIQAKLVVNQPGDEYEQEADQIADQVMSARALNFIHRPLPRIQRFSERQNAQIETVSPSVDQALATPGRSLEPSLRQDMEQRFGYDFSQVRVHSGMLAEQSTRDVDAHAYTVGHDIVFGASKYAPDTHAGRKLLAHELTHVLQQNGGHLRQAQPASRAQNVASSGLVQRQSAPPPANENVWGFPVTRSMCGCRPKLRDGIAWSDTARATYAACDTAANPTSTEVEACFDAAHPTSSVVASTSSSGTMSLPAPSADPCERIENRATFVHETMHARHTDAVARAQGSAFFREWRKLAGDPDRVDKLRPTFPAQITAFETQWHNGHDWAQDEVNSYRWERRFLVDVLSALNRIC